MQANKTSSCSLFGLGWCNVRPLCCTCETRGNANMSCPRLTCSRSDPKLVSFYSGEGWRVGEYMFLLPLSRILNVMYCKMYRGRPNRAPPTRHFFSQQGRQASLKNISSGKQIESDISRSFRNDKAFWFWPVVSKFIGPRPR